MVKVKDAAQRKANYVSAIGAVPGKYQAGIQATSNWKERAIQGQGLYEQRMRDAEVLSRRERGLNRTSDAQWKQNAAGIGAQRIATGMQAGAEKQTANYEPYAAALRGLELPERTADPMANIDARVKPVVSTMVQVKQSR